MGGSCTRNIQIILSSSERTNEIILQFQNLKEVLLDRNRTDILLGESVISQHVVLVSNVGVQLIGNTSVYMLVAYFTCMDVKT